MHPYIQDMRVTYRRMDDAMARSERRRGRFARRHAAAEPVALRESSELVSVVQLRTAEQDCCADQSIAS